MSPPLSVCSGLALSFFGLILGLGSALQAHAQSIVRSGSESVLLGTRNGEQVWPAVAANATGGLVVWEDNTIEGARGGRGIAGAHIGSDLTVTGAPFRVNSQTIGSQERPQTVLLAAGQALVTWETRMVSSGVGKPGLSGRIISTEGLLSTPEFDISPSSTTTNLKQKVRWTGIFRNRTQTRTYKFKEKISNIREHAGGASLVALPDGGAIVVYHGVHRTYTNTWTLVRETKYNGVRSVTNDYLRPIRLTGDWMQDVYLQRIDATGQKVGAEVQVNQYDAFNQRDPSVALLANGNVLIAWVSERPQGSRSTDNFAVSLYAREMTPSGESVRDEFAVGDDGARMSANPVVATVGTGFAIYWSQHEKLFSTAWNVYGRVFDSAANPAGSPQMVNVYTTGDQFAPRVAASGRGGSQFILWTSVGQDGSREGVYGRSLAGGMPSGDEFRVHTTVASRQHQAVVSGLGDGRFITLWSGYSGPSGFDLYSQVYSSEAAQQ